MAKNGLDGLLRPSNQWLVLNFYIGQVKKNQKKTDILSKHAIFRSLPIEAASIILLKSLKIHKKIPENPIFAHNVIYVKNRKLHGNVPVTTWRFIGNYSVFDW